MNSDEARLRTMESITRIYCGLMNRRGEPGYCDKSAMAEAARQYGFLWDCWGQFKRGEIPKISDKPATTQSVGDGAALEAGERRAVLSTAEALMTERDDYKRRLALLSEGMDNRIDWLRGLSADRELSDEKRGEICQVATSIVELFAKAKGEGEHD